MKTSSQLLPVVLLVLFVSLPVVAQSRIKLNSPKDLVLNLESRKAVMHAARKYLGEKSSDFLVLADQAASPYTFEEIADPVVPREKEKQVEGVAVNYDDSSVLRVVAASFAQQVRGTLGRGRINYLQLKGGNMIKPGTSFPVSIPQAQGQTFVVTVTDIGSHSYTLQLGEATETVSLNSGSSSSGAVKFD